PTTASRSAVLQPASPGPSRLQMRAEASHTVLSNQLVEFPEEFRGSPLGDPPTLASDPISAQGILPCGFTNWTARPQPPEVPVCVGPVAQWLVPSAQRDNPASESDAGT